MNHIGSPADAPLSAPDANDRDAMRRAMRKQRRSLTLKQRRDAAAALRRVIARSGLLRPGARIAMYLAYAGEMDLSPLMALALRRGCELYLPVVTNVARGSMEFVRFETARPLRRNRFGIQEPEWHPQRRIQARQLDAVLLPLVAVDARGWRLGSGAGFYDRHLRHRRGDRKWRRPKLIGVAYDFQRVAHIEPQPWDVPLDAVATDRGFHVLSRSFESSRYE